MVRLAALALAALNLVGLATEAHSAPPPAPEGKATPWSTGTAPPPAPRPAEDSTLALRIYRDGQPPLPYRPTPGALPKENLGWATDVSAVMTRCADGSLVITALVIGGRFTPLDARCPGKTREGTSAPAQPGCDARTWTCTTTPAR